MIDTINNSEMQQYPITTNVTFKMDIVDLDVLKKKLGALKNDETIMFIFDKTVSYHPKYKNLRHSLFNLSHFLFAIINDDKHTALAYQKEEIETISIFNNNELVANNTLEDLSLNDFKLIGINNKAKNFLETFKDVPSVIPQYFFYKIEDDNKILNIKCLSSQKSKKILKEDLTDLNFLSFPLDKKFIVLGNNFNFTKSIHFIPYHDVLLFDYIFLYLNSVFFKTFIHYSYGEFCTIDAEILMNAPIALIEYSEQSYYSWDRQLFLETATINATNWDNKTLVENDNLKNSHYNINKIDYFFDKIFDFIPDE